MHRKTLCFRFILTLSIIVLAGGPLMAGPLPGAIFTTLEDGSRVNANIYETMEDVFLDGGPGLNAPSVAASLPPGDYYFQVTDPPGKVLLSEDPVKCRRITVSDDGVIVAVIPAAVCKKIRGVKTAVDCQHKTGIDVDHADLGAITVQLMPYKKTPNKGGVYKVWITPVERFVGDPELVDNPDYFHGFIPAWSKTDNYKVRQKKPFFEARLEIRKFHDSNLNCTPDEGEEDIAGWRVDVTDPLGVTNTYFTPASIIVDAGTHVVLEEIRETVFQTTSILNGVLISCYPNASTAVEVEVAGENGEAHEIIYGNANPGTIQACKFYDRNGDGFNDNEPPIAGWKFRLMGNNILGNAIGPIEKTADDSGCTSFAGLLPGTYVIEELIPAGSTWYATGETMVEVSIESRLNPDGTIPVNVSAVEFGNICLDTADFSTKGYWHNKNGLAELTSDQTAFAQVLSFVHSLDPYAAPSDYYDKGDEPFNGMFADGELVPSAKGVLENEDIAPAGSIEAELSNFLIGSVGDGGIREQLAEQLLAFIFNAHFRLDHPGAFIELPSGDVVSAVSIINAAVEAWSGSDGAAQQESAGLLDAFNNGDAIPFVRFFPCQVMYE